jgi:hypothetical protein
MKKIKFSILGLIISLFFCGCCDESTIIMKYHFFSRAELEDIYMNTDSIMSFQSNVSEHVTFEQFNGKQHVYFEIDTVLFLSENGDTITCRYDNLIQINDKSDELVINPDTKSTIGISLNPLDNCFISGASFSIQKPSDLLQDSLSKRIGFWYPDYKSKGYDVYLYKSGEIDTNKTYFIVSREAFSLNSLQIDNCLFVRFFDEFSNLQALIVYSNKYGFLKIKNTQHEITRIL